MATSEERMKILRMIQEGKITAEEGIRLMETLEQASRERPVQPKSTQPPEAPRWFRVLVTDTDSGKIRVNVRLPINLVSAGMKMGARFSPEVDGMDPDLLMRIINSGETGKVVDVIDDEDGEHVEVFIE
ncbi:MAG: hypothetical protein ABFD44_12345 [Anaerolineaceae bacterium]